MQRNATGSRSAQEDIRIVTMMVIELVINMERDQDRQVDLQDRFIDSLTQLDIGLTGEPGGGFSDT